MTTMTRDRESSAPTICLLMAFELGERSWKLGFSTGVGHRPRVRQIPAGAVGVIAQEILRAKMRLGVPVDAPVMSCYEAGRESFWLHRYLVAHGITNHVVDSSSIEVNRRARRAKTDRLDRRLTESARSVCSGGRAGVAGGARAECAGRRCPALAADVGDAHQGSHAADQSHERAVDDARRAGVD